MEKHGYILSGRIDLLIGGDGKLEILDFKARRRPRDGDLTLKKIYLQLCIYAHILQEKYGKNAARAYVYWTGERDRDNALIEYTPTKTDIQFSALYFDKIVGAIERKEFEVHKPPDINICLECDSRMHCSSQGIIEFKPS